MKNCVVWSGGLDSTLVLHELIKQKAEDVSTISFVSDTFGSRKQELEKHARISYMKNVSKELITNEEIPIVFPYTNIKGKNESLCQQPFMISLISLFGKPNTIYHFGYHKGDDFFSMHSQHMKVFENISEIMGEKNIKLSFPLKFMNKWEIIDWIEYYGLENYVWKCETPENSSNGYSECGDCVPCKTFKEQREVLKLNRMDRAYNTRLVFPDYVFPTVEKQGDIQVEEISKKFEETLSKIELKDIS